MKKDIIEKWRFQGREFHQSSITQPDAVPSLQDILQRVLAGQGTGLSGGDAVYDETDLDFNFMDKIQTSECGRSLNEHMQSVPSDEPSKDEPPHQEASDPEPSKDEPSQSS